MPWISGFDTYELADPTTQVGAALGAGFAPAVAADQLAAGEATLSRVYGTGSGVPLTASQVKLTYFTAQRSESITRLRLDTAGTAAGATPTLAKMGVYSVDAAGNLTLVAATASDTSLFGTAFASYSRSLASGATWQKIAGQRYAFAALVVTAAATPSIVGTNSSSGAMQFIAPIVAGAVSAQSDLPATVLAASVVSVANTMCGLMLP